MVQWLRLRPSNAEGVRSIPVGRTKVQGSQKIKYAVYSSSLPSIFSAFHNNLTLSNKPGNSSRFGRVRNQSAVLFLYVFFLFFLLGGREKMISSYIWSKQKRDQLIVGTQMNWYLLQVRFTPRIWDKVRKYYFKVTRNQIYIWYGSFWESLLK